MSISNPAQPTPERIMQFSWGFVPRPFRGGNPSRIFDVLDEGAKTVDQVSKDTGASARGLTAIMNALVGLDFLVKDEEGRYSLAAESRAFLVSTKPGFQGGLLRHCSQQLIPKWLHLNEVVATGKPAAALNQQASGGDFFQKFVNDIFPMSYPAAQALAQHLHLNGAGRSIRVLDLGAGSGVWGIVLAQSAERVRVTALDWPEVIPVTKNTAARFGLAKRFSFIEGDLFQADFGSDYNIATLGHILHSEGEARSRALLEKTFRALASGGTIAIAEFLVNPDRRGPVNGLFFAVNMLVHTDNGDTYSFEEIGTWLRDVGFVEARRLDSPGPSPLILATKP